MITAAAGLVERQREKRLRRAQNDLWYLATKILKRGWNPEAGGKDSPFRGKGLTEELHKPLCGWIDRNRSALSLAYWFARWHHKTELVMAQIIQDILRDPCVTLGYFHGVDLLAGQVVQEVAWHLQNNPELRKLDPIGVDDEGKPYNVLPARNAKKFVTADQFTVRRHRYSRFPTLFGKGVGSETTGLHMSKAYLDDIIGRKTIEDSGLAKVKTWFQNTLMPVVDDSQIRVSGTRWHIDAVYEDWIKSPDWKTVVLPCAVREEDDFITDPSRVDWSQDKIMLVGDKKLAAPIYGPLEYRGQQRKKLVWFMENMGQDFDPQMMNDPSPAGEKPWDREACEHIIPLKETHGPGLVVVLSDPAPAKTGSMDARGAKWRGDGTKDDWATCVVKIRRNGMRNEIILLDGKFSKEWDVDEGFDMICDLKRKWGASKHAVESTGQAIALYENSHKRAADRAKVPFSAIELEGTYRGNAKNVYFSALASRAKNREFFICETCDPGFREKFLAQAREWRPQDNGGNSLRYDDCANVVSFATDPALQNMAPQVGEVVRTPWELADDEEPSEPGRTRYCAA